jgi:predicted nucleic acid-binding protein
MVAIDTNVFIYACDRSEPRRQAQALDLITTTSDAVLLWQVAVEFIAASRRLSSQGFTAEQAWNRLHEFLALLPLVTPGHGMLARAEELHTRRGVAFWDALIVAACADADINILYSEDLPGANPIGGVRVVNPFA